MKHTKQTGETSEAIILAELLKLGKIVLKPWGDNQKYDLVVDEDGTFIRIQCKTGKVIRDGSVLRTTTCSSTSTGFHSYHGKADFFIIYCPQTNKCYACPVGWIKGSPLHLRLKPPKHCNGKAVRYAKDFELHKDSLGQIYQ